MTGRHRRPPTFIQAAASTAIAAAVIAGAVVVQRTAPDEVKQQEAFISIGEIGEPTLARDLAATIHDVTIAEQVTVTSFGQSGERTTDGRWVVVDASVATRLESGYVRSAVLVIGTRSYRSTNRFDQALLTGVEYQPDLPMRGHVVFEIPADLADQAATVQLARAVDTRLDSMITMPLDLSEATVVADATISPPVLEVIR